MNELIEFFIIDLGLTLVLDVVNWDIFGIFTELLGNEALWGYIRELDITFYFSASISTLGSLLLLSLLFIKLVNLVGKRKLLEFI